MPQKNILFIMCDQLRQDYLSCYGHPTLATPNIDNLAARGVRFTNAYCQAPLCGPSRASFYSGRYMSSHGVMGNDDATQLGEMMIADYLEPLGYRTAVVGKTHTRKSVDDMRRVGMDLQSAQANANACGGFEPYECHEGLYPDPILSDKQGYTEYLRSLGYDTHNPWEKNANSGKDESGQLHSGWALRSSKYAADIREEHSETAFCTDRAIDFIEETGAQSWCLHLSYIKPHWPVMAPAPYHNMYSASDLIKPNRSEAEKQNPHPVYAEFMQEEYSLNYSQQEVAETVIPVYMGLVKQIDDHLGRLFHFMGSVGQLDNTLIVFTADHGDYLGDHWLGEKDLFHEPSAKIPLIVVDPRTDAEGTRGDVRDEFVESVDLIPSFLEFAGGSDCTERLEGTSLLPLTTSSESPANWREFTISEIDYSERGPKRLHEGAPYRCRAIMVRNLRWKYVHYQGFDAQLFDLENDPNELADLGTDSKYQTVREYMMQCISKWQDSLKRRPGINYEHLLGQGPDRDEEYGIIIGRW